MSLPAPSTSPMRAPVAFVSPLRPTEAPLGRCIRVRPVSRVRRPGEELLSEGLSYRHTAIAVIRLAGEHEGVPISVLASTSGTLPSVTTC